VSSDVQAVVDWFGPTDFALMDTQAGEPGNKCTSPEEHDPASSPESAYIGAEIQAALDTVAQANPITYIETATSLPAFSIAHGKALRIATRAGPLPRDGPPTHPQLLSDRGHTAESRCGSARLGPDSGKLCGA
jgi:hypothetical protein